MILSRLQFRNRFTQAEKVAIYEAEAQSTAIRVWLDDLAVADEVDTAFPDTIAGVMALEQAGLIAPGRAAEILGTMTSAGGFTLGQQVTVNPPFSARYPGAYSITALTAESAVLDGGAAFAFQFLEAA